MSSEPESWSIPEAVDRFLDSKSVDVGEKTVRDYRDRLRWVTRWCDEHDIETVAEFDGMVFDRMRSQRAQEVAPATVKGTMVAVNQLVSYLERVEAVDPGTQEKVEIPSLDASEETSDTLLEADDAEALLEFYRDDIGTYGTEKHALLELAWNTGARMGGLRSLDMGDYERRDDGGVLEFVHRPQSDTPLKNKLQGERVVRISETVCEVLDYYIQRDRHDKRDDHGRKPLLTTRQGRPSGATIRAWMYLITQPCAYTACPHGKQRQTCQYRQREHSSKCPSCRSPHQVRSGSITWQLDQGIPLEHVASRVNASAEVIARFYDKASHREEMMRRSEYTAGLDIDTEEN